MQVKKLSAWHFTYIAMSSAQVLFSCMPAVAEVSQDGQDLQVGFLYGCAVCSSTVYHSNLASGRGGQGLAEECIPEAGSTS